MSNKERWLSSAALLISLLPFILVAGALQMLPDFVELPVLHGEAEKLLVLRKGQYLTLGFLGFAPATLVGLARILRARRLVERNFMFMVGAAFALGIVFLIVSAYGMIYTIVHYKIDLLKTFDFFGGTAVTVSLAGGMLANFFPSLRRNDVLGLKNKYTMRDNRVWVKVHYVAADVYMCTLYLFSVFSAALSIFLDFRFGWVHIVLWVLTMVGLVVWGRLYSRYIGKKLMRADAAQGTEDNPQ